MKQIKQRILLLLLALLSAVPGIAQTAGTPEHPLTVAEFLEQGLPSEPVPDTYVSGYIVGFINDKALDDAIFGLPESNGMKTNILIAAKPDETDINLCIPVQLPLGSEERDALNLVDNPGNLHRPVILGGSHEKYFGTNGLKSVFYHLFTGPAAVMVGDEFEYEGLRYRILDTEARTCEVIANPAGVQYAGDVVIPAVVVTEGYEFTVTEIGESAFQDCNALTSVVFPETLTWIGMYGFMRCTSLVRVDFPESLMRMAYHAFDACTSLESVDLPDSLTVVGGYGFQGCTSLVNVKLPANLEVIEVAAFNGCTQLAEVNFPETLTRIESTAFNDCTSLTGIEFPNSLTEIQFYSFQSCTNLESIVLPASLEEIGRSAFSGCANLSSVTYLAEKPIRTDADRFDAATYETATLNMPNATLEDIEATEPWSQFKNVVAKDGTLPAENPQVGEAFEYEGLWYSVLDSDAMTCQVIHDLSGSKYSGDVVIPAEVSFGSYSYNVIEIGYEAFRENDGLTSVTFPESIQLIQTGAFYGCTGLQSVTLPESLTEIWVNAFYGCDGLTSVTFPESLQSIGMWAFYGCTGLTGVTFHNSLTKIEKEAFYGCTGLTDVTLPESLSTIGIGVFSGCTKLETVRLPAALEYIMSGVFLECPKLMNVEYEAEIPVEAPECFDESVYELATLKMPNAMLADIAAVTPWNLFKNVVAKDGTLPAAEPVVGDEFKYEGLLFRVLDTEAMTCEVIQNPNGDNRVQSVVVPDVAYIDSYGYNVVSIGDKAFWNYFIMSSVELPESVTSIGSGAFRYCKGLPSIDLPSGLTSIGSEAFMNCESLVNVRLPESLTILGESAFSYCTELQEVYLPESLVEIGPGAFGSCTNLKEVTLPQNLTELGNSTFVYCENLTSVSLPESLVSIGKGAFNRCSSLQAVNIPEQVTSIGASAFASCTSLTEVVLPPLMTEVRSELFYNCGNLANVVLPDSLKTIGVGAFMLCSSLTDITIPASLVSLERIAFSGAVYLRDIKYLAEKPCQGETSCFTNSVYEAAMLTMPNATLADIAAVAPWNQFKNVVAKDGSLPAVEPERVTFEYADPADGAVVGELTLIETYWNVDGNLYNTNPDVEVEVRDSGETLVATGYMEFDWDVPELFHVHLNHPVSEPGSYTVLIPAGIIVNEDWVGVSEEVTLHYTVEAPVPPVPDTLTFDYADPADGATVTSLDTIYTYWNTGDTLYDVNRSEEIAVVNSSDEIVATARLEFSWENPRLFILTLDTPVTAPGEYTIRIFPGALEYGNYTALSEEVVLHYTVEEPAPEPHTVFIAGKCTDWSTTNSNFELTDEDGDGVYTLSLPEFSGEFKIMRDGMWTSNGETLASGEPYRIFEDNSDYTMTLAADPALSVHFSYEFESGTLTVYYETPVVEPEYMYLRGMMNDWGTYPEYRFEEESDGKFVLHLDKLAAGEQFKVASDNWLTYNYTSNNLEMQAGEVYKLYDANDTFDVYNMAMARSLEDVTITVDLEDMTILITSGVAVGPEVGEVFEYEGLWYTVTDGEALTCETRGGTDWTAGNTASGDLVIPGTAVYGEFELTVTGIGELGFDGCDELLSVDLPASVRSVPANAFTGCERLTSVILHRADGAYSNLIDAVGNPNMLVYVDTEEFAPKGMSSNVVVMQTESGEAECASLVLEPGRAFRAAKPFTALHSEMTKEFTQKTPIDGCAGWESIVLPFDATSVRVDDARGELTPFGLVTDIMSQYPYWLYEADGAGDWKEAFGIKAGVPCIISMPNNEAYESRYNIDGNVIFSNDSPSRITPETTAPYAVTWPSGREFRSLWLPLTPEEAETAMGLNIGMDNVYDDGELLLPGSAFCREAEPQPLEAYVTSGGSYRPMRITRSQSGILMTEADAALRIEPADGGLTIWSGADRWVDVFRADGVRVASCDVKAGEPCRVGNLEEGVYIVAGRKLIIR